MKYLLSIFITSTWTCSVFAAARNELPSQLLYASYRQVSLFDVETMNSTVIYNPTSNRYVFYTAYHHTKGLIYWSDEISLYRIRYPTVNKNIHEVISSCTVAGIAIDEVNDYVYWCCQYSYRIQRSDMDGSNQQTIIDIGYRLLPFALALDVANEWLYFSTFGDRHGIMKCKSNGNDRQTIVTNVYVYDLAIDVEENRIYWTDTWITHEVNSANFDGSNIKIFVKFDDVHAPFGIVIYNSYLLISVNNKILRVDKTNGSNQVTLIAPTSNLAIYGMAIFDNRGIECKKHKIIQNEEKRSRDYIIDSSTDISYSDESLEGDWYRVISNNGDEMTTYPPGVMHCGTTYPVWLNGSLPSIKDGNVTRQACVQTSTNICQELIEIEIRNCGGYFVYHLQNTPPNSTFCFGHGSVTCPKGQSSESGYFPGCSSSFPAEAVSITVTAELIHGPAYHIPGNILTPSLLPVFRCLTEDISNGTFVYDVYWYINGENVTVYKNVPYDSLNITYLRTEDWINTHRMNMKVKCAIRLRYCMECLPGPFVYSLDFPAGIYPEKYNYNVIEGDYVDISFTSTVPVACIASNLNIRKNCEQNFNLFQPKKDDTLAACTNNIANRDIVFKAHFCGIGLGSLDWNESKTLQVYGFSDGLYNRRDRSTYIRLSASSTSILNEFWKDIQIPDIKVTVIDKDSVLKHRLCQSYNDPHITTFDGRLFHYMEVGEFVMYRNDRGPYWVHVLLTNCGFGWPGSSCHCGIAVRSRNSLFVLRTCETISRQEKFLLQQPITELITCDDNDLLIDHTGSTYKITLPIGTEIIFTISDWSMFISVISIKPSIYDIQEAKGLCGVPSKTRDPIDDFTHRTQGPIQDEQTFASSWRISSYLTSEQLFISEPEFRTKSYVIDTANVKKTNSSLFCVCEREARSVDSFDNFNNVQCNLTESSEYCSLDTKDNTVNAFYTTCSVSGRRRRSVYPLHNIVRRSTSDNDDVFDFQPLSYDDDFNNTEVVPKTFRNGWTEEKARQQCIETIRKTVPSNLFSDFVDLQEEFFIQSCIKDIELTGDTTFMPDTIGTIFINIQTELSKNESLYFMATSDGSQTILEYITSFLCPNNCSNNGNCTLGVCSCREGFAGNDCSKSISTPPSNLSLPSDGVCTLGSRACKRTNVFGYFPSTMVWGQLNHFEIFIGGKHSDGIEEIVNVDYRNMFMVSVRLGSSRRKRAISQSKIAEGYQIRLSNDGLHFGDSVTIIIYDEKCYSCNATTASCIDLGVCQLSVPKDANDNFTMIAVIAAVVAVVLVFVVLVFGVICSKRNRSQAKRTPFETTDLQNSPGWINQAYSMSDIDFNIDRRRAPQ